MIFPKKLTDFNSDLKAEEYKKFIRNLTPTSPSDRPTSSSKWKSIQNEI